MLKNWLLAMRPKTLWASISPVLMGIAIAEADSVFHWPSALAALLGAIAIQIGTNFANDYHDWRKGADTADRLGPTRATQAGLISPSAMRTGYIIVFGIAMLFGVYLVWRAGLPIVIIGLTSIFLGVVYTATRWALAYTGLADFAVLIFFGPVAVAGTYYVQALKFSGEAAILGLAPGLFSVAILTVNNLRDIEQDRKAGRKTLVVRFGKSFARAEYLLSLVFACSLPALTWYYAGTSVAAVSVVLVLLPAIPAIRSVFNESGPVLNGVLAKTGQLLLIYVILFAFTWGR